MSSSRERLETMAGTGNGAGNHGDGGSTNAPVSLRGVVFRIALHRWFAVVDLTTTVPTAAATAAAPMPGGAIPAAPAFADPARLRHLTLAVKFVKKWGHDLKRQVKVGDLVDATGTWVTWTGSYGCTDDGDGNSDSRVATAAAAVPPSPSLPLATTPTLAPQQRLFLKSRADITVVSMRHVPSIVVQKMRARFLPPDKPGVDPRQHNKRRRAEEAQRNNKTVEELEDLERMRREREGDGGDGYSADGESKEPRIRLQNGHGGQAGKRKQGDLVAEFLIRMMLSKKVTAAVSTEERAAAVRRLCSGSGVLDVAGGSGFASLGMALAGIKSTVIDPRKSVGCLPARDRKLLRKAIRRRQRRRVQGVPIELGESQTLDRSAVAAAAAEAEVPPAAIAAVGVGVLTGPTKSLTPPPVAFSAVRAWFGERPLGVDADFDGGDDGEQIPVVGSIRGIDCDWESVSDADGDAHRMLLENCSAVVALHPDEATGAVVEWAVRAHKPFVVVPCCVYSRLFPERRTSTGGVVSNREELVAWLCAKDPAIRTAELPFSGGANTAVYCAWDSAAGNVGDADGGSNIGVGDVVES